MTTNEAFEILKEIKILDDSMYQYNIKYLEALDMAINALKLDGILQKIRQEILDKYITATGEINTVANGCLTIIDKHIKESEE
jgi:hypothetical protein